MRRGRLLVFFGVQALIDELITLVGFPDHYGDSLADRAASGSRDQLPDFEWIAPQPRNSPALFIKATRWKRNVLETSGVCPSINPVACGTSQLEL